MCVFYFIKSITVFGSRVSCISSRILEFKIIGVDDTHLTLTGSYSILCRDKQFVDIFTITDTWKAIG